MGVIDVLLRWASSRELLHQTFFVLNRKNKIQMFSVACTFTHSLPVSLDTTEVWREASLKAQHVGTWRQQRTTLSVSPPVKISLISVQLFCSSTPRVEECVRIISFRINQPPSAFSFLLSTRCTLSFYFVLCGAVCSSTHLSFFFLLCPNYLYSFVKYHPSFQRQALIRSDNHLFLNT